MGLQVYCGCDLVMTTGLGGGGGWWIDPAAVTRGGFGSGGGLQAYTAGSCSPSNNTCFPLASAGGGGGGGLFNYNTPCNSGADAPSRGDGYENYNSMAGLRQLGLLTDSLCKNSLQSLLVLGGGGGGTGFGLQDTSITPKIVNAFGGGVGVSFSAGMPGALAAFQRKCGKGKDSPTTDYTGLGAGMDACRQKCLRGSVTDFWPCNCPCMKSVFVSHGMSFAMQC